MSLVSSQATGSTYKNQLCFYTLAINMKFKIQFHVQKIKKYLSIDLTKHIQDFYIEKYEC